jgi:hypothetical protein
LCREVSDSITWRRFCRIPIDGNVPHPTTLMKLTTRCGIEAVQGCNAALLDKAAQAKLLRTTGVACRHHGGPGRRGATTQAVATAAKDGKSTLGQAFAAAPSCSSLTS